MSFDVLDDLNWLAVVVATAIYFGLAGLWFAEPLFGPAWRRSIGWEKRAGERLGPGYYVGPLLTCLVAVISVAMLSEATGSDSFAKGLVLGLVVAVGVACSVLFVTGALDPQRPRPIVWFAITGGYHLIGLVIASLLIAVW
jgi:drug/metabolite transporter (DMT)-like permease